MRGHRTTALRNTEPSPCMGSGEIHSPLGEPSGKCQVQLMPAGQAPEDKDGTVAECSATASCRHT